MIEIDIYTIISISFLILLLLVFSQWIFYNRSEDKDLEEFSTVHQCPFCTHVFQSVEKEDIVTCPNCKSLLSSDNRKKNAKAKK